MADLKISDLSPAAALAITDLLELEQPTEAAGTRSRQVDLDTLVAFLKTLINTHGKQMVWIGAPGIVPYLAAPCSNLNTVATGTGFPDISTLDFDPVNVEIGSFAFRTPEKWDGGTVTYQVLWKHGATTVNFGVVWGVTLLAIADAGNAGVALGTRVDVADTGGSTNHIYFTPESGAVTFAGSPAGGQAAFGRITRRPADANDTLAIDAGLVGVALFFNTNADNDA